MKKLLLGLAAIITLVFASKIVAVASNNDNDDKVTICHATDSQSNPYVKETPNKNGDVNGHDNHNGPVWYTGFPKHSDWGDIIPPFTYQVFEQTGSHYEYSNYKNPTWQHNCPNGFSTYSPVLNGKPCRQSVDDYGWVTHNYPGKNWNSAGQAFWNRNCALPTPTPTPSPTPKVTPTPTPSPTPSPTPVVTPTPTPTPTPVVTPTPSPTPSPTPEVTPTPSPTPSPTPEVTPTPTPSPTPSPTPEVTPTPSPTPEVSPTPSPTPVVTPTPSPTPNPCYTDRIVKDENEPCPTATPSPTPTPSATPESTPGPTATPNPESGKHSSSAISDPICRDNNIDVSLTLMQDGQPVKGVNVKFVYNNEAHFAKTEANGRAGVAYGYVSDGDVKFEPEEGFPAQSQKIELSKNCVPAKTTSSSNGSVLGATTLAKTGTFEELVFNMVGLTGTITTVIGSALYAKQRQA